MIQLYAMKRRRVVFLRISLIAALLFVTTEASGQKAAILVRHTERLDRSPDSALSPVGIERAIVLASRLKDSGISAVYTSDRQRTIKTAEPLAQLLKIKPTVVPANSNEMVTQIRRNNTNDVVLIVGHSNTIPELIKSFGATEQVTIADSDYDSLFIVVPQAGGPPLLLHLHF